MNTPRQNLGRPSLYRRETECRKLNEHLSTKYRGGFLEHYYINPRLTLVNNQASETTSSHINGGSQPALYRSSPPISSTPTMDSLPNIRTRSSRGPFGGIHESSVNEGEQVAAPFRSARCDLIAGGILYRVPRRYFSIAIGFFSASLGRMLPIAG